MRYSFYFVEIRTGDTRLIQRIHIDQPYMHPCTLVRIFESFFSPLMHVITLNSFRMKIYFDHQLYLLFHLHVWEIDRSTELSKRHITIEYVYVYSWCTIKNTFLQSGLFLSDVLCILWLVQPLPP